MDCLSVIGLLRSSAMFGNIDFYWSNLTKTLITEMPNNEATARIRINRMLEMSGWRFFAEDGKPANIELESSVKGPAEFDAMGDDFENVGNGFVDYLLVDERGRPLVVLEAKSSSQHPLTGKEQARSYARRLNCRYVILSNGYLHYFWDLEQGNPSTITKFPDPDSVGEIVKRQPPDRGRLIDEIVESDYIALTKMPDYDRRAGWINESERDDFKRENSLRFLRGYQVNAIRSIQRAIKGGKDRFLFERDQCKTLPLDDQGGIKGGFDRVWRVGNRESLQRCASRASLAAHKREVLEVLQWSRLRWRQGRVRR